MLKFGVLEFIGFRCEGLEGEGVGSTEDPMPKPPIMPGGRPSMPSIDF